MPKKKRRGAPSKHNWARIVGTRLGYVSTLTRGKDFSCSVRSMLVMVHSQAARLGWRVSTRHINEGRKVTLVIVNQGRIESDEVES